jgi:hypothetical protein
MSVEAAAEDRLPWLPDEPQPKRSKRDRGGAMLAGAAAILIVGGTAFWMGARSVEEMPVPAPVQPQASTTVRLPEARPVQPQVEPLAGTPIPIVEAEPQVRSVPVRHARAHKPHKTVSHLSKPVVIAKAEPKPEPEKPEAPQPWPVRIIDGASGRLVRIGAFLSPHQAKRGWCAITKVNPALKHLPALVVPVQSLRNGHVYYRLQMGTTSQAHSAVLCQRMRMIAQSCVVIGTAGMA